MPLSPGWHHLREKKRKRKASGFKPGRGGVIARERVRLSLKMCEWSKWMRGLTVSSESRSDAVDMVKRQPVLREVQLHPPHPHLSWSSRSRAFPPAALHVVLLSLRCSHTRLCLCVCVSSCLCVMEGKEEVCLSLRLCACLWRRGCACFCVERRRCGGVMEGGGGLGAAMRSLRSSLNKEPWRWLHGYLVVCSSCSARCF